MTITKIYDMIDIERFMMISLKNVCLKYTKEFFALNDVTFDVKKGESVALLGEEDSGKTSVLRILCKLEDINSGEVYVRDIPIKKLDFKNDISMGYFPQTPVFMERKTVKQNLEYVLKDRGFTKYEIEQKINEALISYDLSKYVDEKVKNLNLFEKYLIALIRLSFRKLDVVLINNVFDCVKPEQKEQLISLFKKMFVDEGVTCLIATTKQEIADTLCSRIIRFKNGQVE